MPRLVSLSLLIGSVSAFSMQNTAREISTSTSPTTAMSRERFLTAATSALVAAPILLTPDVAGARGRATLEQAYERYAPRIKTGGDFYQNELKTLVAKSDWKGIQSALQEPPARTKTDLQKADAGVAERGSLQSMKQMFVLGTVLFMPMM